MKKLLAVAWIFILSSFTSPNSNTGILSGLVFDAKTGTPIANANLKVFKAKTKIAETKSDVKGLFTFSLSAGNYSLQIDAKGYMPHLMNVYVNAGKTTSVKPSLQKSALSKDSSLVTIVECDDVEVEETVSFMIVETKAMASGLAAPRAQMISGDDKIYIEHNTEEYDLINENAFKDALSNPLSTFSVDVDRASYSNVRRFLSQSQKPYKDAVRIEELINYFDYSYPQPTDGHPFSVTIEGDKCPWNPARQLVLIGLKGENINEKEIPANNLVFLIDVSGSMSYENKLPLLKQAFKYLVEQLRPQDRVAIVVYAGAAGMVLQSTPGTDKPKITAALDLLEAGGSTAGGAGIQLAYKVAKENFIHGGNNRVILATDGDFNVGVSSTSELVRTIEKKRDEGIYLTILGFGMGNYKDGRMEQLSNAGNGNYAYIDNILEAKKMFGTELWGTLYTIAKDVKIQVEFNPAKVKAYRLIGYENRMLNKEDFNDDKKDAGDIGCGHTVTALYEIIPANSDEKIPNVDDLIYSKPVVGNKTDLMTVKIRYKKPDENESKLISKSVDASKMPKTNNFLFASAVAEFGMLLRDSEFKGTASFPELIKRAKSSKGNDENGYKDDFIKLAQMAEMLYK